MGRALLEIDVQCGELTSVPPIADPAGYPDCYDRRRDSVAAFRPDRETGGLGLLRHHFPAGNPSCTVFHDLNKVG